MSSYPKDIKELCDRLRVYFAEAGTPPNAGGLYGWQTRRWENIKDLLEKHPDIPKENRDPDPPPKPPDLGP